MADKTYKDVLAELSPSEDRELVHRKLDCIMQAQQYIHDQLRREMNWNVVDPKLQIPVYPQPNVIIYETPNTGGHPPFYADSDYVAEGWPWPPVVDEDKPTQSLFEGTADPDEG